MSATCRIIVRHLLSVILHFQNARQTEYPEEFVEDIFLAIPLGSGLDDPSKDTDLLNRIGATQIDAFGTEYSLENMATGTRFKFDWDQGSDDRPSYWSLGKM